MSNGCCRLLLIDTDRIFRMGMRSWLATFTDLKLVMEMDSLEELQNFLRNDAAEVDLVILDLKIDLRSNTVEHDQHWSGLEICQQILAKFPQLPIFGLSSPIGLPVLNAALQMGVMGFGLKGMAEDELAIALRQVAAGNCYLGDRYGMAQINSNPDSSLPSSNDFPQNNRVSDRTKQDRILDIIKRNFYLSGINQIDHALMDVQSLISHTANLETRDRWTNQINQMLLAGQARELRAAKWLIAKVWGSDRRLSPSSETPINPNAENAITEPQILESGNLIRTNTNALAIQASLWDRAVAKLQTNLINLSKVPLEIDILKDDKKRELLYIILRHTERTLTELRFTQISPLQLESQIPDILKDIWQSSTTDFFGKYYTVDIANPSGNLSINVVEVLLQDILIIQTEFLDKLPQIDELFAHLLWASELTVNGSQSTIGSVEAMQRSELILDHLLIQIANAVIQPLLNRFVDVESIKQRFYRYSLLATREIEKFRNDLSWKYRLTKYISEPQLIFESRHLLFAVTDGGIKRVSIYTPRNQELETLEGVQLAVTLALELQDAITPRLKSALSFVGSGFVYILTNVIGRGLGLIGKGVLQGIGNAWQEPRK